MKPQEAEKRILLLEKQIAELMQYVKDKKAAQLAYPLDNASRQIVQIDAVIVSGAFEDAGAPYTNNGFLPVRVNGQTYFLMTTI